MRKKGAIRFYQGSKLVRVKLYDHPKERRMILESWMKEIQHIKHYHEFSYIIDPELDEIKVNQIRLAA